MKYPRRFLAATLLAASCQIIHAAGQAHQSVVSTRWRIDELDAMLKEERKILSPLSGLGRNEDGQPLLSGTAAMLEPTEGEVRKLELNQPIFSNRKYLFQSLRTTLAAHDYSTFFCNPFRKVWVASIRYNNDTPRPRRRKYSESQDYFGAADWAKAVHWTGADTLDAPRGELRAEVLDEDGRPIAPFTLGNSLPVSTNSTKVELRWEGAKDLSAVSGRTIRFRFQLKQGSLYAFWLSPEANGASHGYVAGGGPGFPGITDTTGK